MKNFLVLTGFLSVSPYVMAVNQFDVSYQHNNFEQVADSNTLKLSTKIPQNNFFESIYGDVEFKKWDIKDSPLDDSGVSGHLVGYYNFGKDERLFGVTQLQLGSSNLFPKSTLYQEISYRAGEKKNILLGAGFGYQNYYDDDSDTFYKIGPVYYFDSGAVGYKFGKYNESGSKLNSLFGNYKINDKWDIDAVYNFGEGYWDYQNSIAVASANVKSSDFDIKLSYHINPNVIIHGNFGETKIKDKDTNKTSLSSDNAGIGVMYNW